MSFKLPFYQLNRYDIILRLVDIDDADFVLSLRSNPKLNRYISATSNALADQIEWIRNYKEREKAGVEYYFITTGPRGERWGTTRITDIQSDSFELGSWVFTKEASPGASVKAEILTKEIGFDEMGLEYCTFNVRKDNTKVLKYHSRFNPKLVREDEKNFYFQLKKEDFYLNKQKLINLI